MEHFVFEEFLWKVFMMTFCNFVVKIIFRKLLSYKEHVGNFFGYEELLGNFFSCEEFFGTLFVMKNFSGTF
jgi:hypothetical protein